MMLTELIKELVKNLVVSCGDHGVNVDIWSAGGGGEGIVTPDLHLHHHGGLPRTLHIHHLCMHVQEC